jgi:hypothetical protein
MPLLKFGPHWLKSAIFKRISKLYRKRELKITSLNPEMALKHQIK